jgi:SAM-dependent methyltransferase
MKIEESTRKLLNPYDGRNYGRHHLKNFLGKNASRIVDVLDIGAGNGEDLAIVKSIIADSRIKACEWDKENCKKLESLGAEVFQCDLERDRLPYGDSKFDLIIADQIFEHIKDVFWLTHELSRTLKVGGHLYIAVPNLASFHNRILLLFGHQPTCNYSVGPHVRGFTVGDLKKFFGSGSANVWKLVSVKGANFYPFPKPFSTLLAKAFPKAAVGSVLIFEKVRSYNGHFLDLPKGLETNFFVG